MGGGKEKVFNFFLDFFMSCNAVGKFPGERAVDLQFSSFSFSCVGSLVERVGLRILLSCLCCDFFGEVFA